MKANDFYVHYKGHYIKCSICGSVHFPRNRPDLLKAHEQQCREPLSAEAKEGLRNLAAFFKQDEVK